MMNCMIAFSQTPVDTQKINKLKKVKETLKYQKY